MHRMIYAFVVHINRFSCDVAQMKTKSGVGFLQIFLPRLLSQEEHHLHMDIPVHRIRTW